jgi:hypothetical protein
MILEKRSGIADFCIAILSGAKHFGKEAKSRFFASLHSG